MYLHLEEEHRQEGCLEGRQSREQKEPIPLYHPLHRPEDAPRIRRLYSSFWIDLWFSFVKLNQQVGMRISSLFLLECLNNCQFSPETFHQRGVWLVQDLLGSDQTLVEDSIGSGTLTRYIGEKNQARLWEYNDRRLTFALVWPLGCLQTLDWETRWEVKMKREAEALARSWRSHWAGLAWMEQASLAGPSLTLCDPGQFT